MLAVNFTFQWVCFRLTLYQCVQECCDMTSQKKTMKNFFPSILVEDRTKIVESIKQKIIHPLLWNIFIDNNNKKARKTREKAQEQIANQRKPTEFSRCSLQFHPAHNVNDIHPYPYHQPAIKSNCFPFSFSWWFLIYSMLHNKIENNNNELNELVSLLFRISMSCIR